MAGLADDWKANRQACVNVLCAYLRLPADQPDAKAEEAKSKEWLAYRADLEVRHTIIRAIAKHPPDQLGRPTDTSPCPSRIMRRSGILWV